MNLKKIICEVWGKKWDWCTPYWDNVILCVETRLLATLDCPVVKVERMLKRDVPTSACAIHKPPAPPLPKWRICSISGREATRWCPMTELIYDEPKLACRRHRPPDPKKPTKFVMFSYDLWRPDYGDDEFMESITRLGRSGCDYVRTFLGWPGDGSVRVQPFIRSGSDPAKWAIRAINPEWKRLLQRFQRMMAQCGMGIMVDFFGLQMSMEKVPHAWFVPANNTEGFGGYKDTRPEALEYCKWLFREVMGIIGLEGNLVHLGCEQRAPGDGGSWDKTEDTKIKAWARAWAVPLASWLRNELKIGLPLSTTGEEYEGTGKRIVNELEAVGWDWADMATHWHGVDLYENWAAKFIGENVGWAKPKWHALSDDGGGYNIPPEKRGVQHPTNPERWSVNAKWRIDTARRVIETTRSHFHFIEWMPMSMKTDTCRPGDLDQAVDIDVYWRAAEALWGVDIRRKLD